MSLTASMWSSVSGLLVHGEKMNVVGNNIANVNTVGFKAQRMDFQDFVYQYMNTAAGQGQVGRGASIGIIINDFDQGAIENTTSDTDISIAGTGFFGVRPKNNNSMYYTRAGDFTFDKDGYLVSPHRYVVQGWRIDQERQNVLSSSTIDRDLGGMMGTGPITDVKLDTFTCPPRHTTSMTLPLNLKGQDELANDKTIDATSDDPFFALLNKWNGADPKPLGDNSYAYQTTMEVYDEGGRSHTLTIYFDRVTNQTAQTIDNNSTDESYWEYIVTMDPAEDMRDFSNVADPGSISTEPDVPAKLKGLLGAGTLTFSSTGTMKDMTCFVPDAVPNDGTTTGFWKGDGSAANPYAVDLTKFVSAPFNENNFPLVAPNFSGAPGQASAYGVTTGTAVDYTHYNTNATGRLIALDFGMSNKDRIWDFPYLAGGGTGPGTAGTSMAKARASDIGNDKRNVIGLDGQAALNNQTTMTCQGSNFYEHPGKRQDGYTYGDLRNISVSNQGVLSGSYSNGVTLQLFQIALYDFPSKQNLRREGSNLFTETRESGPASWGAAGSGVYGTTQGRTIEQSNVDLSREFVNMITTQRGFQANSKSITTVDTMLETVIQMKR